MSEILDTLKDGDNEGTASPYWMILDPRQNMNMDVYMLASQISGPFFSREDAQTYMDNRRHHFSRRAKVFCHPGHFSHKYENLCKEAGI